VLHTESPARTFAARLTQTVPRPGAMGMASAVVVASLAGCGGSSSSPAPASPPAPVPLSVAGTAASGLAMAGATVEIKCSGGAATATSAADGSYSAAVDGAALPCMVRATSSDGSLVYHSALGTGGGSSSPATINVTPLTELILAVAIGDPTQVDATFSSNATLPGTVAGNLAASETTVAGTLAAANINISGIDPVSTPLVAATATSAGDAQDQAIATLMANLAANQSGLTELATALDSGVSPTQAQQQAVALLAGTPSVSQCASARAGTYWWVNHNGSLTTITLNSSLSTVTIADVNEDNGNDPETDALTWGSGCQATFTQQDTAVQQVTFASGGEFAAGNVSTASIASSIHIAIPVQKIALADLAGAWNAIQYNSREQTGGSASATQLDTFTIDTQGLVACASGCTSMGTLTANADGSFTRIDAGGTPQPTLVFRGADGKLNLVSTIGFPDGGGLVIGVPVATANLPALNASSIYVQYQFSGIPADGSTHNWATFDIDTYSYTVSALDSTDKAVTRTYSSKDGALYDLVDAVEYDQPSTGFRMRPAVSFTDATGTTFDKPTSYTLPLGTGMSVFADGAAGQYSSATPTSTSAPFFGFSVTLN
jgi:hypothetical protein